METTTTTTKPLYKVLDEKRTQGILEIEENPFWGNKRRLNIDGGETTVFVIEDYTDNKEQIEANAQYTALAVNNLAPVADLLSEIVELLPKIDTTVKGLSFLALKAWMERSKEALNKIS